MNRLDHHSQRLNDVLFALVLVAAAACTGWIAAAQAEPAAAPAARVVELERVVVVGQREAAPLAATPTIVLPPVVITGKRIDDAVARAASRANNG